MAGIDSWTSTLVEAWAWRWQKLLDGSFTPSTSEIGRRRRTSQELPAAPCSSASAGRAAMWRPARSSRRGSGGVDSEQCSGTLSPIELVGVVVLR